jgi:hypothetical protein
VCACVLSFDIEVYDDTRAIKNNYTIKKKREIMIKIEYTKKRPYFEGTLHIEIRGFKLVKVQR